jgi:cell fate regulator YaaT (PSP1 superfamily)
MSCSGCAVRTDGGVPAGCGSNGNCLTGGCNKLNTHNWLAHLPIPADLQFPIHEVSFKNGLRKGFFYNTKNLDLMTGDTVVVDGETGGFDVGKVSLSGELVKLQMKKRKVSTDQQFPAIQRMATEGDLERLTDARAREGATMIRSRVIARELNLDMKIGEVEYQGDGKKATFYYIADGRVDFRELIKVLAREFNVKIEMRQIGARQEAGKIGGIGSCGRELCCSTWLTDFKSVSTTAARYQNLSINQAKLSGQCGRLKCCLNYELDTYMDALSAFPKDMNNFMTKAGKARLIKTDIFRQTLEYALEGSSKTVVVKLDKVLEIRKQLRDGETPEGLEAYRIYEAPEVEESVEDLTGHVTLSTIEKAYNKKKKKSRNQKGRKPRNEAKQLGDNSDRPKKQGPPRRRRRNNNRPNKGNDT